MFEKLKKLFRKPAPSPPASPQPTAAPARSRPAKPAQRPAAPPSPSAHSPVPAEPSVSSASPPPTPTPLPPSAPLPVAAGAPRPTMPEVIQLPLDAVIAELPEDIRSKFSRDIDASVTISLPSKHVLDQLATGAVKMTFGDLKRLLPAGAYTGPSAYDQVQVQLPLAKILSRINPVLLPRRSSQKRVDVPSEVTGLVGSVGQPLPSPAGTVVEPVAQPPIPQPAPAVRPPAPAPAPTPAPIRMPEALRPPPAPQPPEARVSPAPQPIPGPQRTPPPAVTPAPVQAASPSPVPAQTGSVSVPLDQASESWPENIRTEIAQMGIPGAVLELPIADVAAGVKVGKVSLAWGRLLGCLRPAPTLSSESPLAATTLEVPLRIVVPLFMKSSTQAKPQKQVVVTDEIPNLFSADIAPAAPAVPAAPALLLTPVAHPAAIAPAPTVPAPAAPSAPAAAMPAPPTAAPAPAAPAAPAPTAPKTPASPAQIVAQAAGLTGMQGAIIALQDGLQVASQLPPPLNGDVVAAFLPQIFIRMSQYTRELNLGELNQLTFMVGAVPWALFKVGAVYFAAVGSPGTTLPAAQLAALAAEVARQNR